LEFWLLLFGIYLLFGAWDLEFIPYYSQLVSGKKKSIICDEEVWLKKNNPGGED
jgi:hypothetical protein